MPSATKADRQRRDLAGLAGERFPARRAGPQIPDPHRAVPAAADRHRGTVGVPDRHRLHDPPEHVTVAM